MLVSIIIVCTFIVMMMCTTLYEKYGFGKSFFHDKLRWHEPDKSLNNMFDGVNMHSKCKYCGRDIIQDSQGNWFECDTRLKEE